MIQHMMKNLKGREILQFILVRLLSNDENLHKIVSQELRFQKKKISNRQVCLFACR